jgi:hypothetical protein
MQQREAGHHRRGHDNAAGLSALAFTEHKFP